MKVLLIIAGTNDPSNAEMLSQSFIGGIKQHGDVTIDAIKLKELPLEHFSLKHYDESYEHEGEFKSIQRFIEEADGIVIATPVWNFGVPAHLKNLVDRMGSFALDAETRSKGKLKGKPFFLILTGGAPLPAWKGLMKKTTSFVAEGLQYFGASYIGHHFEGKCVPGRGEFGLVVDKRPDLLEAVRRKGYDFGRVVAEYAKTGKAPVRNRLRDRIMRWGERVLKKVG